MPESPRHSWTARWAIGGRLVLETALQLGGDERGRTLPRDGRTGQFLLPGTHLAGALRAELTNRLAGYGGAEPARVAALFGGAATRDGGIAPSPLIVHDALAQLPPGQGPQVRRLQAIAPVSGAAAAGPRELELLPPLTVFPLRLDLLVSGRDVQPPPASERELLRDLALALEALAPGGAGLGGYRARGLGQVRATWTARRFDLTTPEGWLEWLTADHERPWSDEPRLKAHEALRAGAPTPTGTAAVADRRQRVVFDLDLELVSELRAGPDDADATPVFPGTSLAGALRAQARRIAELFYGPGPAQALVAGVFDRRLRVSEARLEDGRRRRRAHLPLDRFTQAGAGAWAEHTVAGGRARPALELQQPRAEELGLVLLALKDLLGGRLSAGGGAARGCGILRGGATVTFHDGADRPPRQARLTSERPPEGEAAEAIDAAIRAFRQAIPGGPSDGA